MGAATLGDHTTVRGYLAERDRAAELTGDRNDFWFAFGPTNVAIHHVWLATEMGDVIDAIDQAERVDTTALPDHLSERRASHLITVGWAHYLRHVDDEALAGWSSRSSRRTLATQSKVRGLTSTTAEASTVQLRRPLAPHRPSSSPSPPTCWAGPSSTPCPWSTRRRPRT